MRRFNCLRLTVVLTYSIVDYLDYRLVGGIKSFYRNRELVVNKYLGRRFLNKVPVIAVFVSVSYRPVPSSVSTSWTLVLFGSPFDAAMRGSC